MTLPPRITALWINSLPDPDLLDAESELHQLFAAAETAQQKIRGERYELMRGPAELMDAWNRWSVVNTATRARGLHPRYRR